jgi:hypothetical protein
MDRRQERACALCQLEAGGDALARRSATHRTLLVWTATVLALFTYLIVQVSTRHRDAATT